MGSKTTAMREGKPYVRFEVAGNGDQDQNPGCHSLTLPVDGVDSTAFFLRPNRILLPKFYLVPLTHRKLLTRPFAKQNLHEKIN